MALTPSAMVPLGTPAADFKLPDTDGRTVALSEFARLARDYQAKGVAVVAINSNDVAVSPDDSPEKMRDEKAAAGYPFPYLYDETQEVARAYGAACTPDFFLFGKDRKLVYMGALDDSSDPAKATRNYVEEAIEATLKGQTPEFSSRVPRGCKVRYAKVRRKPAE